MFKGRRFQRIDHHSCIHSFIRSHITIQSYTIHNLPFPFSTPNNNQPLPRRRKLPQPDPRLTENPRRLLIHMIAIAKHDLGNPHLHDLNTARQARTRIAIQHRATANPLPPGLQQRVLLRVDAQARRERQPARGARGVVAARAAAGRAVGQVARRAVVARADDAVGAHEDAADLAAHAVAAAGGERRERHVVVVPAGAEAGGVREVEGGEGGVQGCEGGGGVEDFDLGAGGEGGEAAGGRVVVFVVAEDELLEGWGREGGGLAAGAEAGPAGADGAVDVEEDEEGATGEDVEGVFVVDGGRDEVFLPVLGCVVEEVVDSGKGLRCGRCLC